MNKTRRLLAEVVGFSLRLHTLTLARLLTKGRRCKPFPTKSAGEQKKVEKVVADGSMPGRPRTYSFACPQSKKTRFGFLVLSRKNAHVCQRDHALA